MSWFNKKSKALKNNGFNGASAPSTGINYDPKLIERFEGHHQSLLKLFNAIVQATDNENYAQLKDRLKKFLNVFETHVLEENLRFYIYLSKCLKHDDDNRELVLDMKKEMSQISRDVRAFIRHHLEFGINASNLAKFNQDLLSIGAKLTDRIEREESSLYTLYLPPESYQL